MRPALLFACAVAGVLGVPACKKMSTGAREEFATKYSCPEDRVEVKERADLDPATALAPESWLSLGTPPDDVKKDPARYEKWKADREKQVATSRRTYSGYEMFEVSGCGHKEIVGCHHPSGRRGGTQTGSVVCTEATRSR